MAHICAWPGAVCRLPGAMARCSTALEAVLLGQGLLDRMQPPPVRQPLDCGAERPATPAIAVLQAGIGVPPISTVQAPHSPSPQTGVARSGRGRTAAARAGTEPARARLAPFAVHDDAGSQAPPWPPSLTAGRSPLLIPYARRSVPA